MMDNDLHHRLKTQVAAGNKRAVKYLEFYEAANRAQRRHWEQDSRAWDTATFPLLRKDVG